MNKIEEVLTLSLKYKEKYGVFPSILIEGKAGIGKSSSVKSWAERNGFEIIDIRLINYDIGDIVLKIPKENKLNNAYAEWLIRLATTKEPVILLLDEVDKAPPYIQRMAYQIILDREVEGLKLSDNVLIVAIQNTSQDGEFNDLRREKPLWDRFTFRVTLNTKDIIKMFLEYAYKNFKNDWLIGFLEVNEDLIYFEKEDELVATPRRWKMLDDVLSLIDTKDIDAIYRVVTFTISEEVASLFTSFIDAVSKYKDLEKIVYNGDFEKVSVEDIYSFLSFTAKYFVKLFREDINKFGKVMEKLFNHNKEATVFLLKLLYRKLSDKERNKLVAFLELSPEITELLTKWSL